MKQVLSRKWLVAALVCVASVVGVLATSSRAPAQEQGKYVTEATVRLIKLMNAANKQGYALKEDDFSIGGGWLKQSTEKWIPLYTIQLQEGKKYRFLAAGDADAKDVDIEVQDSDGKVVAQDVKTDPEASVDFSPTRTGRYLVRIRLYASDMNQPCACLAVVMTKQ